MRRAKASRRSVVWADVPRWGMTSATFDDHTGGWKWRAANRSGRPVATANIEGSSVDVFVVKTARDGHNLSNCPRTRPLSAGSSGTDSLTRSTSAAAVAGSALVVIAISARSCRSASMRPAARRSSA